MDECLLSDVFCYIGSIVVCVTPKHYGNTEAALSLGNIFNCYRQMGISYSYISFPKEKEKYIVLSVIPGTN